MAEQDKVTFSDPEHTKLVAGDGVKLEISGNNIVISEEIKSLEDDLARQLMFRHAEFLTNG